MRNEACRKKKKSRRRDAGPRQEKEENPSWRGAGGLCLCGLRHCAGADEPSGESSSASAYTADIVVKDYGTITVELDAEAAPKTVENFVSLAESGFYDGLTFHRIMDGFMIQGRSNGDGTGGSGETITGEFSANGYDNPLSHTRGTISMARSSDYDSASSQFLSCRKIPRPWTASTRLSVM